MCTLQWPFGICQETKVRMQQIGGVQNMGLFLEVFSGLIQLVRSQSLVTTAKELHFLRRIKRISTSLSRYFSWTVNVHNEVRWAAVLGSFVRLPQPTPSKPPGTPPTHTQKKEKQSLSPYSFLVLTHPRDYTNWPIVKHLGFGIPF